MIEFFTKLDPALGHLAADFAAAPTSAKLAVVFVALSFVAYVFVMDALGL